MNKIVQVCGVILVIHILNRSCYGVSLIKNVQANKLEENVQWTDETYYPEESKELELKKDYEVLLEKSEQELNLADEDVNKEINEEKQQQIQHPTIDKEETVRLKRQANWGYTTSLYPKLPTQSPYANYNPAGPYNTKWQQTPSHNNFSSHGSPQANGSIINTYTSRPTPYNQNPSNYYNQPNNYPSNNPTYQPSNLSPYASSNFTNVRPQNNSYHMNPPYYGSNRNSSYINNSSQRTPQYPNNYDPHTSGNKYPGIYHDTTTQRSPYNPSQRPTYNTSQTGHPNYNPLENTLFHNNPNVRPSNNASLYPYQPQNPYNLPSQGTNTTSPYHYPYPSGQSQSNNQYPGVIPPYNQYSGYPNSPQGRPYNSQNNAQSFYNNSSKPYNPQYPSHGSGPSYSNGIGPQYPQPNSQNPANGAYSGYPVSNGTNTYNFVNSYNPSIPSQPPHNGPAPGNYFYYQPKGNGAQEDPTRASPNRFSY